MTSSVDADTVDLEVVDAYLSQLGVEPAERQRLCRAVGDDDPESTAQALAFVRQRLDGSVPDRVLNRSDDSADTGGMAGVAGVLGRIYPGWLLAQSDTAAGDDYRGASMPPGARAHMAAPNARRGAGRWLLSLFRRSPPMRAGRHRSRDTKLGRIVRLRQILLAVLVAVPAAFAMAYMATVLPHHGSTLLELIILAVAFLLFGWILVGFWTALAGFFMKWRGDRFCIRSRRHRSVTERATADRVQTALVMPICEEDVARSFAGLRAIYESVERTGRLHEFDFFILSDSASADSAVAEQRAWADLCHQLSAFKRVFYRRRRARISRKSGNLADFCRRWGGRYDYMLVLDADSIMAGATIAELVDRMNSNPDAGLIQTPPTGVNRHSCLARVQQFSMRAYGPMFAAGLHYWHLDKAHYWGHNAIIRIAPFMAHCALPTLSGQGPLGGDILSHDFVEAAFMRRAGWGVHIAYDLGGSYEEVPPTLLDELGRDRRWCQGNIQHLRLLFADNLSMAHRALFANGVMAYGSAAIWFVFLVLSSSEAIMESVRTPTYFSDSGQLFPNWPVWEPFWALSLFAATMVVLFLPKILGLALIVIQRQQRSFGGLGRLVVSTLVEIVLTSLLAPIRMLAHSRFFATTLLGRTVAWNSQHRADATVAWSRALRFHAPGMCLALAWGGALLWYSPSFAPWLAPILVPLLLAPALTVFTSRVDLGEWLARRRLEQTPEEYAPPVELLRIHELEADAPTPPDFADAVVDPVVNALTAALIGRRHRYARIIALEREGLAWRALQSGPDSLSSAEKRILMADFAWLRWLHLKVWAEAPLAWTSVLPAPVNEYARAG